MAAKKQTSKKQTSKKQTYLIPPIVIEDGVEDLDEASEVIPYNYEITAYGADYPVDGLVKRLVSGDIVVPSYDPDVPGTTGEVEGFQRRFMWSKPQIDRFIESLLLGLPVPGIFLVRESNNVLLVLDGQQRLRSLQGFYAGVLREKEFKLESVQERFFGLRYSDLDDEDRRRLDDSIIHATVMRQDTPSTDQSSVYTLFERLNTGGTNLQPQEIRVALYRGPFAGLLRELNEYPDWRAMFGNRSERLKDQELILRFFALLYASSQYERPMKGFLNRYMATNRDLNNQDGETLTTIFETTTSLLHDALGTRPFRLATALNAAVFDSVMTGVAHRLSSGKKVTSSTGIKSAYDKLLKNKSYREAAERSTADEEQVRTRLKLAKAAFASAK